MRSVLSVTAAVCLVSLAVAADHDPRGEAKPNTLTRQEVADGWLLLFGGESTFGWRFDGRAAVKGGELVLEKGTRAYPTTRFSDFELRLEVIGPVTVHVGASRYEWGSFARPEWGSLQHRRSASGESGSQSGGAADRSRVVGGLTERHPGLASAPCVIEAGPDSPARVRSVKLRPLGSRPLFDGQTLDGWQVNRTDPKRMRSRWTVTPAGELAVKDGPGDLVSEKSFADFVLQLEARTLGPGLNSGVFFRCIPGQYQNGYEAQIHNGFVGGDRSKPRDFGTGGIYRRVPARKVVADDNEWFTLTVVADGRHIATWVNGYPTVDWTDDRPAHENPRLGYRADPGPISIQGHDPTTDLLFRNIRLAELPR